MNLVHSRTIWVLGALVWLALQPRLLCAQIGELPDETIEECLSTGQIGKKAGRLVGITKPEHLKIECAAPIDSAIFKSLDERRRGITRLPGGGTEMNFSDSYKYERAAYLLDRELSLNMVPVAILRNIKGDEGALVFWIPNASTGAQTGQPTGPQMAYLGQQKPLMRLFDALILNVDRRPDNWMVDNDTWKLYLIDHSRAFRDQPILTETFSVNPIRLPRDLYERLQNLERARLEVLLRDLVTGAQIEALLARRDLIVEEIDKRVQADGEAFVMID